MCAHGDLFVITCNFVMSSFVSGCKINVRFDLITCDDPFDKSCSVTDWTDVKVCRNVPWSTLRMSDVRGPGLVAEVGEYSAE